MLHCLTWTYIYTSSVISADDMRIHNGGSGIWCHCRKQGIHASMPKVVCYWPEPEPDPVPIKKSAVASAAPVPRHRFYRSRYGVTHHIHSPIYHCHSIIPSLINCRPHYPIRRKGTESTVTTQQSTIPQPLQLCLCRSRPHRALYCKRLTLRDEVLSYIHLW